MEAVTPAAFTEQLTKQYGPLLHGKALLEVLGYPSTVALRKAIAARRLDLKLFPVPGRRGPFVLTVDAAHWLVGLRDAETKAPTLSRRAGWAHPNLAEKRP